MTGPEAGQRFDSERIVDAVFRDVSPSPEPAIVVLTGGAGSAPARAVARLLTEYDDQAAVIDSSDFASSPGEFNAEVRECVRFALASRRSLIVCSSTPELPAGLLASFGNVGATRRTVSIAARGTESLLAVVSAQLRQADIQSFGKVESFDKSWSTARSFVGTTAADATADRVTVIDGDGNVAFDGSGGGAVRAFDDARLLPMSNLRSIAWLGELRRLTEYAVSGMRPGPSATVRSALVRLHDQAMEQVLPQLPIRQDGPVAAAQRASLLNQRDRLVQGGAVDGAERTKPDVQLPTNRDSRGL